MNWKELLLKYFSDPDTLIGDIYAAGGINPRGYGYISGGYGGGVYIEQYHKLLYIDGFFQGLHIGNIVECREVMKAINTGMKEKFGPEVNDSNVPFNV